MSTLRANLFVVLLLAPGPVFAQAPAPAANPSFNLVNRDSSAIKEFFVSPGSASNWGRDRLDGRGLAPGAKAAIRLPANGTCTYDLRAVFADARTQIRRGLNTCQAEDVAMGETTPVATAAKSFRLLNRGSAPITSIGARPQGTEQWRTNALRSGPIPAGGERRLDLPPGGKCEFDLRVGFEGGRSTEVLGANLCTTPDQPVQ